MGHRERKHSRLLETYKIILLLNYAILVFIILSFFYFSPVYYPPFYDAGSHLGVNLEKNSYKSGEKPVLNLYYNGIGEVTFGMDYGVEKLVNDTWVEVPSLPPDSAWTAVLGIVSKGQPAHQPIDISHLDVGKYLLIKEVYHPHGDTTHVFHIEFEITRPISEASVVPDDATAGVFRGILQSASFPMERFGPVPLPSDREYRDEDVLVLDTMDSENASGRYFLHCGGWTEMILAGHRGNWIVGGLFIDEVSDAYLLRLPVEVEGWAFRLDREGRTYPVLHVERIEVLDRENQPLVAYRTQLISGRYTPEISHDYKRITLPFEFHVGRNVTGVIWKDIRIPFDIILNPGDRVRIRFNASDPIFFGVYAPNSTLPDKNATRWGVPTFEFNGTNRLDLMMDVFERGAYTFLFDADRTVWAQVRFDCQKILIDLTDLFFIEEGSHGSDFGGMGSGSIYPMSLPSKIVIGRTWSESGAWTDHSYSYKTELNEGDLISIQYNSTQQISFHYRCKNKVIQSVTEYSYEAVYEVELNGTHTFEFAVEEPKTAIVSFRCEKTRGSSSIAPDNRPVSFYLYKETTQKDRPRFPPRFEVTRLRGKLNVTVFPVKYEDRFTGDERVVQRNVLVFDFSVENQTGTYYLYLGVKPEMIFYPLGGHTFRGNFTLFDIVQAYERGLSVEVEGFPFELRRNDAVYEMFHLNSIRILDVEELPLYAIHDWDLVSGNQIFCYDEEGPQYFPVSFRLGPELYEDVFGTPEHFYHVFLYEGEKIEFMFNSTAPVEFGLYMDPHTPYSPGVLPFSLGEAKDYLIRESGIEFYQKEVRANKTGYYSFAFKAWRGKKSEVILDCRRLK